MVKHIEHTIPIEYPRDPVVPNLRYSNVFDTVMITGAKSRRVQSYRTMRFVI